MFIAYCFASGHVEFGDTLPEGAIEIARGRKALVRKHIGGTTRLAYDNTTLLVPGVLEAVSYDEAEAALVGYLLWLKKREAPGSRVNTMRAV